MKGFRAILSALVVIAAALTMTMVTLPADGLAMLAAATAKCDNGELVSCSGGTRCTATDGQGCICYDADGNVVDAHLCSEVDGESGSN